MCLTKARLAEREGSTSFEGIVGMNVGTAGDEEKKGSVHCHTLTYMLVVVTLLSPIQV